MATRLYKIAHCCNRTYQGWHLSGREFRPPYEHCFACGGPLAWKDSTGHAARSAHRSTVDYDLPLCGKEKSHRIDLGIDILHATAQPGVRYTHQHIAAYCGCSDGYIYHVEKRALRKLRKKLGCHGEAFVQELRSAVAAMSRPSPFED